MPHVHSKLSMLCQDCAFLCFTICIAIASGSWYDRQQWELRYPSPSTFVCPPSLPITSVYSEFNQNTSQREWKFRCDWNGERNVVHPLSWSYANEFQKDFSFYCSNKGAHFISGIQILYSSPSLADGRWKFGCGRFSAGHRLENCTVIPATSSIGRLQQAFEYTATDNTTFVTGFSSVYDIGLKDRMWGLAYCQLGIVRCAKPPQPEGVIVAYDSLRYGGQIKYRCQTNYTYVMEETGSCDGSGLWTISPPDCQPCAKIPYCLENLCTSYDVNATICLQCREATDDGLPLSRTMDLLRCESKPMITESLPKVITFNAHDLVTLNCNASGYPRPKVTWLHNSSIVNNTNRILLLSNGSLVLREAFWSDVGLYTCVAHNSDYTVSVNVTLQLRKFEPPVIMDWTNTLYFPLKQSAELHCKAAGHPEPNIIWYKDGHLLQHKRRVKILSNGTLLISKLKKKDGGRYRCIAKNRFSFVGREAFVHVYDKVNEHIPEDPNEPFPPVIQPWKLLVFTYTGSRAVLNCNSIGNPQPTVKWFNSTLFGDKLVKNGSRHYTCNNGSLIIENVHIDDKGEYRCRASNLLGSMKKHLLLVVKPSPLVATTAATIATLTELSTTTSTTEISSPVTPTNSSVPIKRNHLLSTEDSHASTLKITPWLYLCICSVYMVLSLV